MYSDLINVNGYQVFEVPRWQSLRVSNVPYLTVVDHHYNFLKKLTEQGSGEGMFRYCEPNDGSTVLKEKLQELFDFVLSKYVLV